MSDNEVRERNDDAADKPKKGISCCGGCLLIVVALVALLALLPLLFSPKGDSAGATQACRDAIRMQLKNPASASFANERAEETSERSWKVTGIVRADNSFGGTVPTPYTCNAAWNDKDDYYTKAQLME